MPFCDHCRSHRWYSPPDVSKAQRVDIDRSSPNRGEATTLADIELAVQTELPLIKQHLCDTLWATRGKGAYAERVNRLTGERAPLVLQPSTPKN